MKRKNKIILWCLGIATTAALAWTACHILLARPDWIQGRVECTVYRATAKIAGRIERMPVQTGQQVVRGQLLYTLSTPELDAQLQRVETARNIATAIDCAVDAGERLNLEQTALRQWHEAQAGEELARKTYERIERLCRDGVVYPAKRDESLAAFKLLSAEAEAARIRYKLIRESKCNTAPKDNDLGVTIGEFMRDAAVYAPVDGEVAAIVAQAGEFVGQSTPVVSVLDTRDLWVEFSIPETRLNRFKLGAKMDGYIPSLDRDIALEVKYLTPKADFTTWTEIHSRGKFEMRTFIVKMQPKGCDYLRPGMSVLIDWKDIR